MASSVFAMLYDLILAPFERLGLLRLRREIVRERRGMVLEIGAGTGRNLPLYENTRRVVAVEPDAAMLSRARRRAVRSAVPVCLVRARVEDLPFTDESFDGAVATMVFCSVGNPDKGFAEISRVLRPDAEFHLLEHVRSRWPLLGALQDCLTPTWSRLTGGCRLNRPTVQILWRAGFLPKELSYPFTGVLVRVEAINAKREKTP